MKKIISIPSIIIVGIILPILLFYYYGSTQYLNLFFEQQMIPLMGTIMALNFATATSLQAILYNIEENKKIKFEKTRNEIEKNLIFMIIVFILTFILQVINLPERRLAIYFLVSFKLLLFFLYFYILYDLNRALFRITNKI